LRQVSDIRGELQATQMLLKGFEVRLMEANQAQVGTQLLLLSLWIDLITLVF
jgi:hypothetical protein